MALQRLVQAAVWFLGENANYAASEYAWESATPPGTALMMLDADKMVAAASSRNPTLASALTRLQRCAFSGSWEIRIAAVQALTTIAIRSGEPYRLQIYEFLHALALGGVQSNFSELQLSNGENQGASGTGLGSLISPMLKVLDEMYRGQDDPARDIRQHDNSKQEWSDEELKKLYETHERLLDFVSLFCFVPRAKYLPLGPTRAINPHAYTNETVFVQERDEEALKYLKDIKWVRLRLEHPAVQTVLPNTTRQGLEKVLYGHMVKVCNDQYSLTNKYTDGWLSSVLGTTILTLVYPAAFTWFTTRFPFQGSVQLFSHFSLRCRCLPLLCVLDHH
ncbi:uncharacterized protein [Zea mays]|nr:uncharacterized protein LOC118473020 [Zea mays]